MKSLLYDELVPFYHLLDPLEDHEEEATVLATTLLAAAPEARTLLELGAGAGHGAHFIKRHFAQVTLTDLSEPMLARSKTLNPECAHHPGDMRTLRLAERFDAVLIHDAICYLTTQEDLLATMRTAFAHLRPGGVALIIPDCTKESFTEGHEDFEGDDGERSLRAIEWSYDPDPDDDTHLTDFAFLLRCGNGEARAVHDRHVHGLFSESIWLQMGAQAGFEMDRRPRPLPEEYRGCGYTDTMFLARRPTTVR